MNFTNMKKMTFGCIKTLNLTTTFLPGLFAGGLLSCSRSILQKGAEKLRLIKALKKGVISIRPEK